jgi:pimeloyl-ACP methyl ester carboxylesterase
MSTIVTFPTSESVPLSGWYALPDSGANDGPVLVALHGGGYSSHYWRFESLGEGALARVGPAEGLTVVALNRPGTGLDEVPVTTFDEQADLIVRTIAGLLAGPLAGSGTLAAHRRPVVLVGHSIGAALSCIIAARHSDEINVVGIDVSGFATRFRAGESLQTLQAVAGSPEPVVVGPAERTGLFFGDPSTWDQSVADEDNAAGRPAEPLDLGEVLKFPESFAEVAAKIDVPVNYSLAGQDIMYESDDESVELVRAGFTASPAFTGTLYDKLGHCIHLHREGPDIVRRAVEFAKALA